MRAARYSRVLVGIVVAGLVFGPVALSAKPIPSDKCALLPASELQSALNGAFGKPTSTVAPAPFPNIPTGTDCTYAAAQGSGQVLFRIYVDPSPAIAKDTFAKLSMYYPAKPNPPHVGDSAYIDKSNAIHVLKGSVRFYINAQPAATDAQLVSLATSVAKQL